MSGLGLNILYSAACIVIGYLCGCISTGYLVGRLKHVDIQKEGSGNLGATNALRTTGLSGGLITLAGDILKALLPVLLVKYYFFNDLAGTESGWFSTEFFVLLIGLAIILGHNFPFWMHFKGGKGIASTGGILLAFHLPIAGVLLAIFLIVAAVTRYVSLASLIAVTGVPIAIGLCYPGKWALVIIGAAYTVLAFVRHRANIVRLLQGNENKLGQKKEK
ncbi:MAG: glycerol-3-phosphate 1-O-acyltransferase PlsY [Lachnospiraceae bacterium]|jgi:glycerol-3-phosphate acyltransferase PlsY|nr:glycerol-3-phosphate 1-O-acyltransferase PlsY [Lachnospiraceae bacterium]